MTGTTGLTAAEYLEGLAFFAAAVLPALAGGALARRLWFPDLRGTPAVLAYGIAASALVALSAFVPGVFGIATRWTVAVTAIAAATALALVARAREPIGRPPPAEAAQADDPATPVWSWVLAGAAAAAVLVGALAFLYSSSARAITGVDAIAFHLPTVARWVQHGSLWEATELQPDLSSGAYPHTGNLMYLVAMLPWSSAWTARYVGVPFLAMAAVGMFTVCRSAGAPASTSLLVTAAICATYAVAGPALDVAMVDVQFLAWFLAGVVFLIRWSDGGRRRDLVLAGIGLGLALGTKWYGLVYVPVALGVWAVASVLRGRARGDVARACATVAAIVAAVGGFWLLRNLVTFGSPLQPAGVRIFGLTIFDAPPNPVLEIGGFAVFDYITDADVLRDSIIPALWRMLGAALPIFVAGAVAAAVVAARDLRNRRPTGAGRILAVAIGGAALAALYTRMPYSAGGPRGRPHLAEAGTRYVVPGLVGLAAATAWLAVRAGRLRLPLEIALVVATLECMRRAFPRVEPRDVVIALAVVAALAGAVWLARTRTLGPRAVVAVLVTGAAVAAVAGRWIEQRPPERPYGSRDATIAWIEANAPEDRRIALAGYRSPRAFVPILPAFGPRLRNEVEYVGHLVQGTLRPYADRTGYITALERGGYDLVLVARGRQPRPTTRPPQVGWTAAAGYKPVAESPFFVLMGR